MARRLPIFYLLFAMAWTGAAWRVPSEAAGAQKIAVLLSTTAPPFDRALEGFQDYLQQKKIPVTMKAFPEGVPAGENEPVDLIFALGSEAMFEARVENPDTPIVAGMILKKEDIVNLPNATGVYLEHPLETQFRWMRKILPNARRIGVVYSGRENRKRIEDARKILKQMGLQLVGQEVSDPRELPAALENLANTADALWGLSDPVVLTPQTARPILLFSFRNRIPFIGLSHAWTRAGALYSLDRDYYDIGRQCGELAYRVLQGEYAGIIPPMEPRKVTYSLNLKAASRMKLDISSAVRHDAEEIY